jgi:hypothetical protein
MVEGGNEMGDVLHVPFVFDFTASRLGCRFETGNNLLLERFQLRNLFGTDAKLQTTFGGNHWFRNSQLKKKKGG